MLITNPYSPANTLSTAQAAAERDTRRPPHNLDAERALLGAILSNNGALHSVSEFLTPDHFFDGLHGRIYEVIETLIRAKRPATATLVQTYFADQRINDDLTVPQYLGTLIVDATVVENAAEYGRTIRELATRRSLIIIAEDIANEAYNGSLARPSSLQIADSEVRLSSLSQQSLSSRPWALRTLKDAQQVSSQRYSWKGVFGPGEVGLLFGVSQAGKGFFLTEFSKRLCLGLPMFGRKTRPCPVLQVQYEGGAQGLNNRVLAAVAELDKTELATFGRRYGWMANAPFIGRGKAGDIGVAAIIDEANALSELAGEPVGLVTIDTMAKSSAGDSMNDDDAVALQYSRGREIAAKTGAAVMFITHPGHRNKDRPAGSHQLLSSPDFGIRIDVKESGDTSIPPDSQRRVTLVKTKDGGYSGITLGQFQLAEAQLAVDEDGDPITSCVVVYNGGTQNSHSRPQRLLTPSAELAYCALCDTIATHGTTPLLCDHVPSSSKAIEMSLWRAQAIEKGLSGGGARAQQQAFKRAKDLLVEMKMICTDERYVWLADSSLAPIANIGKGVNKSFEAIE